MRGMVLDAPGEIDSSPLALREVDDPEPGPGEVRLRVRVCAVCRTDLHVIEGDLPPRQLPIIPGHQVVGDVDRLGAGCQRLELGQRAGIAWLRSTDGTCRYCQRGRENLCPNSRYTGYHANGGYAEFAVVPEAFAYELPEGSTDVEIAPLLCAGLIGYRVNVVTRSASHQQLSRRMGAVWAGDDMTRLPEKMDSAILFAPAGELVPPALEALDRGGVLSLAGIHMTEVPRLDYEQHLFYEKELRSVTANTREDGRELLAEAAQAQVKPHIVEYPMVAANRALQDLKHSRIDGTGVLVVA
jgi:alcohol dehydrogenase, propanol-preferring